MIRFVDIVLSIVGLIIFAPFLLLIVILIIIESKGGAFYKQVRVGLNGKNFNLYKLRSMYMNSDKKGLITVGEKDPRITKVGYFIRKYKLDELPQLFNVLVGDMSFVGPRPEVRKYVDMYTEYEQNVLTVKPGITDYASIKYSQENDLLDSVEDPEKEYVEEIMPKKIELNMIFIKNKNIKNYLHILYLTIKKIC